MTNSRQPIPRKKKSATSRRSPRKTTKKAVRTTMPIWLRNVLVAVIVAFFSVAFYYFFIRPYAYRWKPCYGLKAYGICVPCCYDVHGIDISHYQGDIDWGQLTQSRLTDFPIEFVFMKATEIMAMILLPVTFPKRESTDLFVVPIISSLRLLTL